MHFFLKVPKWYPLLNSKYHKTKAEIKMSLYLDDDSDHKSHTETVQTPSKYGNAIHFRSHNLMLVNFT